LAGTFYHLRGEDDAARPYFERAATLQPDAIEPISGIVAIDLAAGQVVKARALIEQRLARQPKSSGLLVLAARTYVATGDAGKAEAALLKAIQADAANPLAYDALGQLYISQH